ncbi:MAG TPA: Verru_Chthon cassette protein B [Candidatus Saccharimonadia bacterium]|nr:Verru_Chthon cassette protein B [Candidatus Saccharimonadia bacterium]
MNMKTPPLISRKSAAGFSLAETTVAVGIAASVIVTLVGMIPLSLDALRQSSNVAAEARIVQAIAADYRMREWSEVLGQQQSGGGRDYIFDGQGTRVKTGDFSAIFTARVTVADAPTLPGMLQTNPRLKSVKILMTESSNPDTALSKPETCRKAQTLVAQMDKYADTQPAKSR